MTFNEKLIKLRKLRGITQDEFASAVGVSRQAVYKWESGQSYPEVSKLIEIKNLFNISIDDLLDDNYEVILPPKKKRLSQKKRREIENIVNIEEGIIEPELEIETVEEEAIEEEAVAVASAPVEKALSSIEETATVEEAPEVKEEVVTPAPE